MVKIGGEIYSELKNTGKIIYGGNEFTEEFLEIHEEPYPGISGFIHIAEVATGWIKHIKDFVRVNQSK